MIKFASSFTRTSASWRPKFKQTPGLNGDFNRATPGGKVWQMIPIP